LPSSLYLSRLEPKPIFYYISLFPLVNPFVLSQKGYLIYYSFIYLSSTFILSFLIFTVKPVNQLLYLLKPLFLVQYPVQLLDQELLLGLRSTQYSLQQDLNLLLYL